MAGAGRTSDKAAARGPTAIQSTIQSIKEVVGAHSDADIYAALRECNMDPNETTQKLLHQDPFHEVKRKRDKKRESAGQQNIADTSVQVEHNSQWTKPRTQRVENDQKRAYNYGQASELDIGPSREFRVVRDNRHGVVENRPEVGHKDSPNLKVTDRSVSVVQSDRNRPPVASSPRQIAQGVKQSYNSDMVQVKRQAHGTSQSQKYARPYLKNSQDEPHAPSDPAHVPSNLKAAGGTVGAIRRHTGGVGVPRQPSGHSSSHMHVTNGPSHVNIQRGNFAPGGPPGRHFMSKNMQPYQRTVSDSVFRGRPFVTNSINRYNHGPASNQKATQPAKEWKPKSTKKSSTTDADNNGTDTKIPSARSTESANTLDVNGLCDQVSQANMHEMDHVIIPEHLRVPEYEQTRLKFGSFTPASGSEYEQTTLRFGSFMPVSGSDQVPNSPESEEPEHVQETVQLVIEEDSLGAGYDEVDEQARSSQLNLSTSTAEISLPPSEDSVQMSGEEVENDDGLGLVESDTPLGEVDGQNIQSTSSLTSFSAYGNEGHNMHPNNEPQMYRLVEPNVHAQVLTSPSQGYPSENPEVDNAAQVFRMQESNVHSQVLPSTSEALSSHIVSSSPIAFSSQMQHISQQQPAAQLYPPVHMQHYPNFMPYRHHMYSPVYVPPMAMPSFPTNVPYPSNGNNFIQMPGGGSHLAAGGVKYGQYKPVPAGTPGYGNYTHPAGYTISSPGVIGAAVGVEDVNRIKYKDSNLYAPSQQVETSDIWIQTPREMPTLQCPPYYNLPGQATSGAFVPNPGNAPFNATAQSSHAQFPGMYHPQQPSSIVSPHPMVHQQVPSAIGPNVGVASPAPQVGAYQQPQLGHWRPSY